MKDSQHYVGHRDRLRQRLERDSRALADYEILELLLGHVLLRQDTKPLAKALLARFGTLRDVFAANGSDLRQVDGFGPKLETFWTLWRETWARLSEAPLRQKVILDTPLAVAEMAQARLQAKTTEEFWVALVDGKNRLMAWECVSQGTVDRAAVYVREVMSLALRFGAHGIILVHNHTGGNPEPSQQDRELTTRMAEAAESIGLRVLDHMVVAEDKHFSFRSEGLL